MPRPRIFDRSFCPLHPEGAHSYSLVSKLASTQNWTKKREEHRKTTARATIGGVQSESVATQHIDRSIGTGNQLHVLATNSIQSVDKTLVDAWSSWDNQMRKTHRLDEEKSESLINIQLLASLPDEPKYIHSECVRVCRASR